MTKQRSEKGEAPVIGPTEASLKTTLSIKQKELSMADSTQHSATRAITVPFHGADLYVVEHESQPYTPMKPIITGMGLTWHGQHAKIKANARRWGVLELRIPSSGGLQDMLCMPLRKLPGWLSGIEAGKVKSEEARAKVAEYQNECDDVLWQYWNDGIAINPRAYAVHPDQTLSAEQADTLRFMLTENVKKLPKEKQAGAMVKGWSKLKAHFKTDYRHIPAGEFHEAVSILARHVAEWELVDDTPKPAKQPTVQEIVADWVKKIEEANGYPAFLFQPLVEAVLRKSGKRLAVVAPGQMVVDRRNLAAVWADLGKLQSRIDAMGCPAQDFPPSWWEDHAIAA